MRTRLLLAAKVAVSLALLAYLFSNHCDFDLADGGLASARYVKVEDGEIYPCLAGGTRTEGADIDALQVLNP